MQAFIGVLTYLVDATAWTHSWLVLRRVLFSGIPISGLGIHSDAVWGQLPSWASSRLGVCRPG